MSQLGPIFALMANAPAPRPVERKPDPVPPRSSGRRARPRVKSLSGRRDRVIVL